MVITVSLAKSHHCRVTSCFLLVMRTFKFDSLSIFQICNTVLTVVLITIINAVHYIPGTYLFYNWKLVPFDSLYPLHPHPSSVGFLTEKEAVCVCVCVCVLGVAQKAGKNGCFLSDCVFLYCL